MPKLLFYGGTAFCLFLALSSAGEAALEMRAATISFVALPDSLHAPSAIAAALLAGLAIASLFLRMAALLAARNLFAAFVAVLAASGATAALTAVLLVQWRIVSRASAAAEEIHFAALMGFAVQFMLVAAAFQLFDGLQAVAAGALRGLQDTRVPMLFALFGYWLPGLGTAVFLGFFTPLQGFGVWVGLAVGLVVVALLMLQRWARRARLGLLPA